MMKVLKRNTLEFFWTFDEVFAKLTQVCSDFSLSPAKQFDELFKKLETLKLTSCGLPETRKFTLDSRKH